MAGIVKINDVDISIYGATLLDGSYNSLLTPGTLKKYLENTSRESDGTQVLVDNPRHAERTISLKFLIKGNSKDDFQTKYNSFINVIMSGWVNLYVSELKTTYRLLYASGSSYAHYMLRACQLTITFREPNPADRIFE